MITIVIPTRNRSYALSQVLSSYYKQKFLSEMIIVDDAGEDDSKVVLDRISSAYPGVETKYIRHDFRKGASASRITGYIAASNELIAFGEDDAYLGRDYLGALYNKFSNSKSIGIVSGRIVYLKYGESVEDAEKRFGCGVDECDVFDKHRFCINNGAKFSGDITVPFTHALFLTRRSLLMKFGYDEFYSRGSGFREETDFQVNLFANSYQIILSNDAKCFHMNKIEVNSGGQRTNIFSQVYWSIYYTNYFYGKYFEKISDRLDIGYGKSTALAVFAITYSVTLLSQSVKRLILTIFSEKK